MIHSLLLVINAEFLNLWCHLVCRRGHGRRLITAWVMRILGSKEWPHSSKERLRNAAFVQSSGFLVFGTHLPLLPTCSTKVVFVLLVYTFLTLMQCLQCMSGGRRNTNLRGGKGKNRSSLTAQFFLEDMFLEL